MARIYFVHESSGLRKNSLSALNDAVSCVAAVKAEIEASAELQEFLVSGEGAVPFENWGIDLGESLTFLNVDGEHDPYRIGIILNIDDTKLSDDAAVSHLTAIVNTVSDTLEAVGFPRGLRNGDGTPFIDELPGFSADS